MHDGDNDGLVRIFLGLSCELGGLIIYLIIYITRHNFSPTKSVIWVIWSIKITIKIGIFIATKLMGEL